MFLEINLPVYKQGDDLATCLERTETTSEAFKILANNYTEAANICTKISEYALEYDINVVDADCHYINIEVKNDEFSNLLIKEKLAIKSEVFESYEEGDSDDENYDELNFDNYPEYTD